MSLNYYLTLLGLSLGVAFSQNNIHLVVSGSTWKYHTGSDPGVNWKTTSYDDSNWSMGPSKLGYGTGDEATVIPSGPVNNYYPSYYFRDTLLLQNSSIFDGGYALRVRRDDGIVVYVNGAEVFRDNMPAGTPTYTTWSAGNASDNGNTWLTALIPQSAFHDGINTIAAEVHQRSANSSDVTFNLELDGLLAPVPNLTRGPYLQMGTSTSMRIRWRTDFSGSTRILYGTTPNNLNMSVVDLTNTTEHSVDLTNLSPATKYYYAIGTAAHIIQGDSINYFRTYPATGTDYEIDLWVTGDCGTGYTTQTDVLNKFLDHIGSKYMDGWLLLGDNAYQNGLDYEYQSGFFAPYQQSRIMKQTVIWPAPGNHDYWGAPNTESRNFTYYQIFDTPTSGQMGGVPSNTEAYYSYNIGNIHIVSLDSYGTESGWKMYDTSSTQAQWLKQDLAANTQDWTILYWHHPPYTKGSHDSDWEADLVAVRDRFIRMIDRYKVDLVLCGHSHCYERSKLMKGHYGNESTFNPALHLPDTTNGMYNGSPNSCPFIKDSSHTENEGMVYVVAGSAGKYGGTSGSWPHNAMFYSNATNGGSLYLKVKSNRLDAEFIADNGIVQDQFTIMKNINHVSYDTIQHGQSLTLSASWEGNYNWVNHPSLQRSVTVAPTLARSYIVHDNVNCVSDTFYVHVTSPAPVIQNLPSSITAPIVGNQCTQTVNWIPPLVTDDNLQSVTSTYTPGSIFSLGTTLITYTAIDSTGNMVDTSFTVTVVDTSAPVFTSSQPDITVYLQPGQCQTPVYWNNPTTSDNCSHSVSSNYMSGQQFALGTTTVLYTANDNSGNLSTLSFDIIVADTLAPNINLSADTVYALVPPGQCSAIVNWPPPVINDNCNFSVTVSHASGSTFPVGWTTVIYTATDTAGNTSTDSIRVEVRDDQIPLIAALPDIYAVADASQCGRYINWNQPTVAENCTYTLTSSSQPGDFFPVGATVVHLYATDPSGNIDSSQFTVWITDTVPPQLLNVPQGITVSPGNGQCSAIVTWPPPTGTDNCSFTIQSSHSSGSLFPLGSTLVTYTITDASSNTQTAAFVVSVQDTTAPVFVNCSPFIQACEGDTLFFIFPQAIDDCSPVTVTQTAGLPSGSVFPVGMNLVTISASDTNGNVSSCIFNIQINEIPSVDITAMEDTICTNAGIQLLVGSPPGGVFSGPGVSGTSFAPLVAGPGSHTLHYLYADINGCSGSDSTVIHVLPCLGIPSQPIQMFTVFPNPFGDVLQFQSAENLENLIVEVSSTDGRMLYKQTFTKVYSHIRETMNMGHLSAGTYSLRLYNGQVNYSTFVVKTPAY